MAKIQKELYGDFDEMIAVIHDAVVGGGVTAEMVESSQFIGSEAPLLGDDIRAVQRYVSEPRDAVRDRGQKICFRSRLGRQLGAVYEDKHDTRGLDA